MSMADVVCRYGGAGAHSRTADLLIYDCTAGTLSQPVTKGKPATLDVFFYSKSPVGRFLLDDAQIVAGYL